MKFYCCQTPNGKVKLGGFLPTSILRVSRTPSKIQLIAILGVFSRLLTPLGLGFCQPKKKVQLIFIKLMLFSMELSVVSFELKNLRQVIPYCHSNQFMRQCWAKNHDPREEKWHFS